MTQELYAQRVAAALVTKGTSGDSIYEATLQRFTSLQLQGDLLEFGAGAGTLIRRLHASGYAGHLTCADIMPRPEGLPDEIDWMQADLNEPLPLPKDSFDVIVSTEVIEHLENPRAAFREFRRILRPGGALVITTPNQESIRSVAGLLFGRHFVAFLGANYPAHITALLEKDFERICAETSFSRPGFYYTNSGGLPKFPHIRWQQISGGLLKGRLFSDNLVMVATKL